MALSHLSFSFLSHFSLLYSLFLFSLPWFDDCGSPMTLILRLWAIVGCGLMVMDRESNNYSFDFGLWVVVQWSLVLV